MVSAIAHLTERQGVLKFVFDFYLYVSKIFVIISQNSCVNL